DDSPQAAGQPCRLNDDVHGRGDLLSDDPDRQIKARHADHHFHTANGIAGVVGVNCRHAAVVPGVHRLEHVEGFRASALTDDDSVRPHTKGVLYEVTACDLAVSLDILGTSLHAHDV